MRTDAALSSSWRACCFGFSMIELVGVLVIISILAVIALPRLTAPSTITLAANASQLAGAIRYAQSLSMSQGQRYRLNLTANSYQITDMSGATTSLPPSAGNAVTTTPVALSGYAATLSNNYVAFNTTGVPFISATTALAATATITLTSGGNSVSLSIAPETGAVK